MEHIAQPRPTGTQVVLTIVIPVYNAASTVERTLLSLRNISQEHRECVQVAIVDDGSTDSSRLVIERVRGDVPGLRWVEVNQCHFGLPAARNAALQVAEGAWLFMLDADDELLGDPLPVIRRYANATAIGCDVVYCNQNGVQKVRRPPRLTSCNAASYLTASNPFCVCSLIIRRSAVCTLFDLEQRWLEDWKFWVDNVDVFRRMEVVPGFQLAAVHFHGRNMSGHFASSGAYRERLACTMLVRPDFTSTLTQRHNLELQRAIGRVQQGKPIKPGVFANVPCSVVLYLKLIAYFALGTHVRRLHPYGRANDASVQPAGNDR